MWYVIPLAYLLVASRLSGLSAKRLLSTGTTVWVQWGFLRITQEGFLTAVHFSMRLVFLVAGTSLLTLTTSPVALSDGLEKLLSPLKIIHFPAHELAMMMTIALRFIPTLIEEADKIMKAQMARGADFESGNLLKRAKAMIPLLVPLFVSAFRRGEGRTRLRVLRYTQSDLWALLATVGTLLATIFAGMWLK